MFTKPYLSKMCISIGFNNGLLINFINISTSNMVTAPQTATGFNITFANSYQNGIFTSVSSISSYNYTCATSVADYSKTGLMIYVYNRLSHVSNNGNAFCIVFGS